MSIPQMVGLVMLGYPLLAVFASEMRNTGPRRAAIVTGLVAVIELWLLAGLSLLMEG